MPRRSRAARDFSTDYGRRPQGTRTRVGRGRNHSAYGRTKSPASHRRADGVGDPDVVALRLDGAQLPQDDAPLGTERARWRSSTTSAAGPTFVGPWRQRCAGRRRRASVRPRHVAPTACTWADFAEAIFERGVALTLRVRGSPRRAGRTAPRPAYSVLRRRARRAPRLPHWRDGLPVSRRAGGARRRELTFRGALSSPAEQVIGSNFVTTGSSVTRRSSSLYDSNLRRKSREPGPPSRPLAFVQCDICDRVLAEATLRSTRRTSSELRRGVANSIASRPDPVLPDERLGTRSSSTPSALQASGPLSPRLTVRIGLSRSIRTTFTRIAYARARLTKRRRREPITPFAPTSEFGCPSDQNYRHYGPLQFREGHPAPPERAPRRAAPMYAQRRTARGLHGSTTRGDRRRARAGRAGEKYNAAQGSSDDEELADRVSS